MVTSKKKKKKKIEEEEEEEEEEHDRFPNVFVPFATLLFIKSV